MKTLLLLALSLAVCGGGQDCCWLPASPGSTSISGSYGCGSLSVSYDANSNTSTLAFGSVQFADSIASMAARVQLTGRFAEGTTYSSADFSANQASVQGYTLADHSSGGVTSLSFSTLGVPSQQTDGTTIWPQAHGALSAAMTIFPMSNFDVKF
jgi:hypothetical protein